jgi:8-oxo-dGTP diphosphatase
MKDKKDIHVLARAVILSQNHILLAYDPRVYPYHYYKLGAHFYYLPGGHVEFKESAQTAIIREIKEESGYEGHVERFLGIIENAWSFPGDEVCCHTHEINLIFQVQVPGINPYKDILQKEKHVAFQWISLKDLEAVDILPKPLKTCIPMWLNSSIHNVWLSSM